MTSPLFSSIHDHLFVQEDIFEGMAARSGLLKTTRIKLQLRCLRKISYTPLTSYPSMICAISQLKTVVATSSISVEERRENMWKEIIALINTPETIQLWREIVHLGWSLSQSKFLYALRRLHCSFPFISIMWSLSHCQDGLKALMEFRHVFFPQLYQIWNRRELQDIND